MIHSLPRFQRFRFQVAFSCCWPSFGLGFLLLARMLTPNADGAPTFTSLVSFKGTNGAQPYGRLALGNDGNFYGTTSAGGTFGFGTIFRTTISGALNPLVSFDRTDGSQP